MSMEVVERALAESADSYEDYLRRQLMEQSLCVARYQLHNEQVWIKKAGPRHGMWRYRLLGALAGILRLDVLRPIPNLGGELAIATEVRRLRELGQRGLRVPLVLAAQPDGFLMRHLGAEQSTPSLADEMEWAIARGPHAVLALWQQGLQAIARVHAAGTYLSQAFARNLVRCPDGIMGYIDFEDDPATVLTLAQCQARDALCFVHSSALYLLEGGALDAARPLWAAWVQSCSPAVQDTLTVGSQRMAWLRHLPSTRRLGRDLQRARAAHGLLVLRAFS